MRNEILSQLNIGKLLAWNTITSYLKINFAHIVG